MMQRATVCSEWWDERVSLALYAHIPAGNLGNDAVEDIADVFYCRLLKQSRHVLWTSQGRIPDLGGHEQDENRMLLSEQMFSSAQRPEVHVRGVRARSARILIISLFSCFCYVTQIIRTLLVSLTHTVQENQCSNAHSIVTKNLTHASRSNTGTRSLSLHLCGARTSRSRCEYLGQRSVS